MLPTRPPPFSSIPRLVPTLISPLQVESLKAASERRKADLHRAEEDLKVKQAAYERVKSATEWVAPQPMPFQLNCVLQSSTPQGSAEVPFDFEHLSPTHLSREAKARRDRDSGPRTPELEALIKAEPATVEGVSSSASKSRLVY